MRTIKFEVGDNLAVVIVLSVLLMFAATLVHTQTLMPISKKPNGYTLSWQASERALEYTVNPSGTRTTDLFVKFYAVSDSGWHSVVAWNPGGYSEPSDTVYWKYVKDTEYLPPVLETGDIPFVSTYDSQKFLFYERNVSQASYYLISDSKLVALNYGPMFCDLLFQDNTTYKISIIWKPYKGNTLKLNCGEIERVLVSQDYKNLTTSTLTLSIQAGQHRVVIDTIDKQAIYVGSVSIDFATVAPPDKVKSLLITF
jgi:hypothetical protein